MKFLFIENNTLAVSRFRLPFIIELISRGNAVTIVSSDEIYKKEILDSGASFVLAPKINNRGFSAFGDLFYMHFLKKIIQNNLFDKIISFQLKPNIFAPLAAHSAHAKSVYSVVEGLGDPFLKTGVKWSFIRRCVCFLLKRSLKHNEKVLFLNKESRDVYIRKKLIKMEQASLINGFGIDCAKFVHMPIENYHSVLMCARLLKTKGVLDFCKAAEIYRRSHPSLRTRFVLAGQEGDLHKADLEHYIETGCIEYIGFQESTQLLYRECTVFVLPSYGEGLPVTILEAMATGRPIVATDVLGCHDLVSNGFNGFLVQPARPQLISESLFKLLNDAKLCDSFGKNSYQIFRQKYAIDVVVEKFLKVLEAI